MILDANGHRVVVRVPWAARVTLQVLALMVVSLMGAAQGTTFVGELREDYLELIARYQQDLNRPPHPPSGELIFVVADQYWPEVDAPHEASTAQREFAAELFSLACRAADAGESSLAFQWATEVLREDPHHAEARRVLGYELIEGEWLTAFAQRMARLGKTWHPQFGWILADDAANYEAGQRRAGKKWVTTEVDARRHRLIDQGWQVRTDHFLVTTNHSIEAGVQLAARLERLHQIWRQLFAAFYLRDREVRQLFAGDRQARQRSKPFHVIYHRSQQQYIETLRRRQPKIAATLGIYFDTHREAHFFAPDQAEGTTTFVPGQEATLYHEAVHQLFQESRPAAKHIGGLANFWVIEGVATYFESLSEQHDSQAGHYFTIGEAVAGRLPAARERALVDELYIPLDELCQLGKRDLQNHPRIAMLYSQAAGLATFFMQADGGQYREPLVRYLAAVYAGRDDRETLADAVDRSYSDLDAQYRRFLQSLP